MSALEAFLAAAYAMGTAVALFAFAIPEMGESYEALRTAREQNRKRVTPTAEGDEWVRHYARDFLMSIVGGLLLVVFWPVVFVGWMVMATARLVWEAI